MKNDFRTIVGEVKLSTVQTFDVDLHNKVDKIEDNIEVIDNSIGELYDRSDVLDSSIAKLFDEQKDYATSAMLNNYYTKGQDDSRYNNILTELENKQPKGDYALKGDIPSLYGYATENWVEDKKYLTKVPVEYVTETELEGKGYLTEHQSLNNYAKISDVDASLNLKADKTSIPTKVSAFTNDAGYLTEHQSLTDYAKKTDIPVIPTKLSAFNNDEGFIKNTVTDLVNYYKKSETYTQAEVNELISKIPKFAIDVVDELPTSEISTTTVYLVKTSETADNMYTEYIYVNNVWEKLGEQKVDLTDYYTKNQIDNFLNEKADKTEIPDMKPYAKISDVDASLAKYASTDSFNALNTEVLKKANKSYVDETFQVKGDYITTIPAEYVTETELEGKGYLTEHQSLTDYAKTADVNTELAKKQDKGDYVSATTLNDYAKKADIPNTSEFITSAYTYNKAEIDTSLDNKADKNHKHDIGDLTYQVDYLNLYDYSGENVLLGSSGWFYKGIFYFATSSIDWDIFDKNASITLYFDRAKTKYIKLEPEEQVGVACWKVTDYNYQYFDSDWYYQSENRDVFSKSSSTKIKFTNEKSGTIYYAKVENYEGKIGYISRYTYYLSDKIDNKADKSDVYTKTEIDNMAGNINNALNGLSFWKGTQEEYDAIETKDDNTVYFVK